MARIFNIYFTYEDVIYYAVVSVRTTPFFTEYALNNINEELLSFLPGNMILSQTPGHFIFKNAEDRPPTPLMNAIIKAVTEHLQAMEA